MKTVFIEEKTLLVYAAKVSVLGQLKYMLLHWTAATLDYTRRRLYIILTAK